MKELCFLRAAGTRHRHIAAASMSAVTKEVVLWFLWYDYSVMDNWSAKSFPELWMNDHVAHLRGTVKREQVGELTIVTPNLRQPLIAK